MAIPLGPTRIEKYKEEEIQIDQLSLKIVQDQMKAYYLEVNMYYSMMSALLILKYVPISTHNHKISPKIHRYSL